MMWDYSGEPAMGRFWACCTVGWWVRAVRPWVIGCSAIMEATCTRLYTCCWWEVARDGGSGDIVATVVPPRRWSRVSMTWLMAAPGKPSEAVVQVGVAAGGRSGAGVVK